MEAQLSDGRSRELGLGCKRESAPDSYPSQGRYLSSPPLELLTDTIDSLLNVVNGSGVLGHGTNGSWHDRDELDGR
jgi:hypothetical protein